MINFGSFSDELVKIAGSGAKSLNFAYTLGRTESEIRQIARKMGVPMRDISTAGLGAPWRAAYHLGKHRNKYLVGGGLLAGVGAAAGGGKLLAGRKKGGND